MRALKTQLIMPETINNKKAYTLFEVTKSIQKTLEDRYISSFWVLAEMNKLNYYSHSGHCYPELLEKKDGKVIALIKANLWKDDYLQINKTFQRVLKEPLKDGIKILFLAKISFKPEHGLALRIIDIDPGYTLGDLEKEKQETITRMKDEGIFNRNKILTLPLLPQRIAIISVETSKGYADFLNVIETNSWNYKFFHLLFPSLLQGDKAVEAICDQLNQIKKVIKHFDIVTIIRGGGGDIGLSFYNNYKLASKIALFPIPVITGIGHSTNETVSEMVSYSNEITPTKVAEYLMQKFHNFSIPVQKAEEKIIDKSRRLISEEESKFESETKLFNSVTKLLIVKEKQITDHLGEKFFNRSLLLLKDRKSELNNTEKNIINMSPENVLKRGYSITQLDGKAIKSIKLVKKGEILKTVVYDGQITSKVESSHK